MGQPSQPEPLWEGTGGMWCRGSGGCIWATADQTPLKRLAWRPHSREAPRPPQPPMVIKGWEEAGLARGSECSAMPDRQAIHQPLHNGVINPCSCPL